MNSWHERFWAATFLALLTGGAAAADGVAGRGHAFRADIVVVRGAKVLLSAVAAPDDGERCVVDAGIMACGDAARDALDTLLLSTDSVTCTFARRIGHGAFEGACLLSDGTDVAVQLLRSGWVRAKSRAPSNYVAAEAEARAERRGIWAKVP
jgi:endonuclease YncB( thermonuclease family)